MNQTVLLLLKYKYAVLFPLAVVEGPIIAVVAGFLVYIKAMAILPAFLVMILGDVLPDSFCYALGHFGNTKKIMEKYLAKEGKLFSHFEIIKRLWLTHTKKTMIVSKLSYGLSTPLLISAGLSKVNYKKFFLSALSVTVCEYGLFMTIGYYLGYSYQAAENYIKYAGIISAVFFVLFVIGYFMMTQYFRKQFIKTEEKEENTL